MTHLQAGLSAETTEKARLELNENPDTLHQDIQQVRQADRQIYSLHAGKELTEQPSTLHSLIC